MFVLCAVRKKKVDSRGRGKKKTIQTEIVTKCNNKKEQKRKSRNIFFSFVRLHQSTQVVLVEVE